MANNNKKIGNNTETLILNKLKEAGYWCHLFAYNVYGQPCDIIALKDNVSFLIDAKHCSTDRFNFGNIEPNQLTCFAYARHCGVKHLGFAVFFEKIGELKWLPYDYIINNKEDKSVHYTMLGDFYGIIHI